MTFSAANRRSLEVAEPYDRLNVEQRGRARTTDELALGFVGDVGDLARLVMADAGRATSTIVATSSVTSLPTASGRCW